jgi:protein SCO1/2
MPYSGMRHAPRLRPVLHVLPFALLALACGGEAPAARAPDDPSIAVERGPGGFYGTEMPGPRPAPALRLVEHGGRPFDLAAERGHVVLLFFGYTHCPDICPTTLADWRRVKAALGRDTARVRFVFVTTDPARDTPEVTQRYARQFDPSFVGLSGDSATLAELERGFMSRSYREPTRDSTGQPVTDPHAGHTAYSVAHTSRVFVIDPDGNWRLVLPAGAGVAVTLADVRTLLAE